MLDKDYPMYENRIDEEKEDHEQRNTVIKGVFAAIFMLIAIFLILGYLFEKFPKYNNASSHSITEPSQTIITPKKD